ncbi:hypothetical protein DAEQUDRAFT_729270 [Daedalea quercina L-15889]|uniref:Uncharacterized protein n=1 Tax=Daedalea quercina L-15889 TaxID=1314783 RepID=A0A165NQ69_9APHY|nr:hypothetical protein DAEQUDRAFT_729270 [Daedalea quercina L-15889]
MMKTRRKSKAAAAAAAAEAAASQEVASTRENSPAPTPATHDATITLAIPDDVDIGALSGLLPEIDLHTPSPDAIVALYRLVVAQASDNDATQRELEEARAEIDRKNVELEQALQDKESATVELDTTLDAVRKELEQVKREKDELATARASLQAQITTLSTTQSTSSSEVEALKHKIEDTEREKRELVTVVSRLKEDGAQREEEIQTLRTNLRQARQDHQALESQLRELRSAETATKFKLDSLSQQLQLSQEHAERMSSDLNAKVEEFATYRRTKHAELAQLQAAHDLLAQTHSGTESQLKALQTASATQTHQLTQALARVQSLQGQLAEQEATFSGEASGLRRLVEMMEAREAQAKAIVEGIEQDYAGVNERAGRREAALKDEIEEQRQRAEQAEKRAEELEAVMERLDRGEFPMPSFSGEALLGTPRTPARTPGTPSMVNGTPDFLSQSIMGLSPTVAMASRVQRNGKTFTEVYADYVRLQEDYARKSAEFDNMDRTLSAVLAQIEERAPILSQQRAEYERLQQESTQLASQLSQALAERDAYAQSSGENAQKLAKSSRENDLLQKQLDDLGRQIRVLLKEVGRMQDPTIPPDTELDETARPAENIEEVITNNLVLFRSIPQLQEQNQKLLKVVRELGAKMESEEKEYRETLDREQSEAVREAHEAIKQLQEQLESQTKSSEVTIQAYMKERDSLRALLTRERNGQSLPTVNGGVNGDVPPAPAPVPARLASQTDLEKELAEVQNQFEVYKTEMGDDSVRLREEAVFAQRESNQLRASLAKANAKIEFLDERHRMVQEQAVVQSRELDSLSKRNQDLYDQYMRIDIECNRVSEELLVATGHLEQMRNECANLRAEKKIWQSVQGRLEEENRILTVERSHLSDLMQNVQKMHSDLERSGENDRRRLENQIQMLENQTQDLRAQLTAERESLRHVSLQKDIDAKDLQTRIEKSTEELGKTREGLVAAETSRKHLEDRVEELTRQLHGNEEKLAVYERRSTSVNGVATQRAGQDMTREQQLEAEVADLRSALKVAQVDLATARSHVQQFQEISQANENALATLNASYDEYKSSTEAELARRSSEFTALQAQLQTVQQELSQVSQKHTELQRTLETERIAWVTDRKTLEDTIIDMSTSERNSENDRASRDTEVKQQQERTRAAEERYASEVVAHAEALKMVTELKEQLARARAAARENQNLSETSQAKLAASESSWRQQREALDKEIADLNTRCKELNAQNNLLHQHLESVSSQAARIKQAADTSAPALADADDTDAKVSELRSVVTYLRREKEIVDLQLELSKQENARLKTQVDYFAHSLEETRKALSEERERAVEAASSEAQHAELVERINQLTILRESNATLRADCESHAKRARELDAKFRQLSSELDPTKEQLRIAQAELEAKDQHIQRLEDESRRWKERNSQLLSKYDRIDPAEVQSLRDEIERIKASKEETESAVKERDERLVQLQEKLTTADATIRHQKEIGQKNNQKYRTSFDQFGAARAQFNAQIAQLQSELQTVTAERDQLKAQPQAAPADSSREQELTQQLESLRSEKAAVEKTLADERTAHLGDAAPIAALQATIASLTEERNKLLAEKSTLPASTVASAESSQAPPQWEAEKNELVKARDEALAQVKAATDQAQKAAEEAKNIRFANEKFQARIQDLSRARAADSERAAAQQKAAVDAAVEKLRNELQTTPSSMASDEVIARHAQELRDLESKLTTKFQEEMKAAVDAAVAAARAESLAASSGTGGNQQETIQQALVAHEKQLKEQHEAEIAAAVERGRMEAAAKGKLKDQQLVRTQNKLRELEAQILMWKQTGVIKESTPPTTKAAGGSAAAPGASATSTVPATISTSTTAATGAKALPRKPSLNVAGQPTQATLTSVGAGRGKAVRSVPRGGAQGLSIKGTAAGRGAPAQSATGTTAESGGVSIMGAAGKRAREEGEASAGDDSLAKRLKPADGGSKPVTLRRDRVPPPS